MNANDPNVALLEIVAERLGDDLREEMVFVGGAVAGLLITDPAMPAIRPTEDVDLVCRAIARTEYYRVETALRARGFVQDMRPEAPICRWRIGSVVVDGRATLLDECRSSPPELQTYLGNRFRDLLANPAFVEGLAAHLPGDLASQERLPELQETLHHIAALVPA